MRSKFFISLWVGLFLLVSFPVFGQVKYLRITVRSAKLWPAKTSGKCWDPCLGRKYKLPPRGKKNFAEYYKDKIFKQACTGHKAPDAFVVVRIGKYESFITDKVNNTCEPEFNVSHIFRVDPRATFTVSVYDNDGAAGFQIKRDEMGTYTTSVVPKELLNGGTLRIRSFGQVEELILSAQIVKKPVTKSCEGVYKVRIAEFDVEATKENGKTWDRGFGRFKNPDIVVSLKIGDKTIVTPKKQDKLFFRFNEQKVEGLFTIKEGMSLSLSVVDKDAFGHQEMIGETAETDVCKILYPPNKPFQGLYTFKYFGRVKRVVLIFRRLK